MYPSMNNPPAAMHGLTQENGYCDGGRHQTMARLRCLQIHKDVTEEGRATLLPCIPSNLWMYVQLPWGKVRRGVSHSGDDHAGYDS